MFVQTIAAKPCKEFYNTNLLEVGTCLEKKQPK